MIGHENVEHTKKTQHADKEGVVGVV